MSDELQRPHHEYSPSTLQSLEACPCYRSKQSATPHPRTVIGSLSHGVIETGEDNLKLTDEDTEKVAECLDFYERRKQLMEEARARAIQLCAIDLLRITSAEFEYARDNEAAKILAEKKIASIEEIKETYLTIDELDTTAGYIDCALINHARDYAEVFDWKLGFWPVEHAENNLQGIAYSLGIFHKFPAIQTVRFFFKQPNLDYVTDATFTRENIPALYLRIQVVVARAKQARQLGDWSMARPMVPACNFCANLGVCDKVAEFACKVGSKFFPLQIPADITPSAIHSPDQAKLGLQLAEVLAVWSKAYKQVKTDRVIMRQEPPPEGYKLDSRTPREIIDAAKYREVALKYLTEAEYETTFKAAFGSVEEMISDKAPRGQKKSQVEQFAAEVEAAGAVVKGDGYTFLRAMPSKPEK